MKLGFKDYDSKLIILTSIALFSGIKADCPNGKEKVNFNIQIFHVAPRQLDASINALLDFPAIMNMIVYLDLVLHTFAMLESLPVSLKYQLYQLIHPYLILLEVGLQIASDL
jgi:hypothetical protein